VVSPSATPIAGPLPHALSNPRREADGLKEERRGVAGVIQGAMISRRPLVDVLVDDSLSLGLLQRLELLSA
jgi:hypothetical protein